MKRLLNSLAPLALALCAGSAVAAEQGPQYNPVQKGMLAVLPHLTLDNFLTGVYILLGVICVVAFVVATMKAWVALWEFIEPMSDVIAFAATAGTLVLAYITKSDFLVMLGAVGYIASVSWCIKLREIKGKNSQGFFMILLVGLTPIALLFGSQMVGYLAAAALVGVLRFVVIVNPLCYGFGYENDNDLVAGTASSLIVLALTVIVYLLSGTNPYVRDVLVVLMPGLFWMSSLAGFVGLLILSSSSYHKGSVPAGVKQIMTCIVFVGAAGLGIYLNISALTIMGIVMFMFFIAEFVALETWDTKSLWGFVGKTALLAAIFKVAHMAYMSNIEWFNTYAQAKLPL